MLPAFAVIAQVFAQTADDRASAGGDSGSLFLLAFVVIGVLAAVVLFLFLRARAPDQSRSRRQDADRPVDIGGTGPSGRPLHQDPDPDRLAGGRSRFGPPSEG